MDPSEVEFLGEKNLVGIVPNFNFGVIYLISGPVGPFRAGLPTRVPIWLATNLKQQQKCRIISQEWMDTEYLSDVINREKESQLFTKMPSNHFMDEAHMLLNVAADDIPEADDIRTAVKDIWDLRMSKLRSSVISFVQTGGSYAKLDHLTAMEINSIRSLLPNALDTMHRMEQSTKSQAAAQNHDATIQ